MPTADCSHRLMKRFPQTLRPIAALLASSLLGWTATPERQFPLDYVDPGIGTAHSRWFFFTPAAMPFGMAKPGPCTDAHLGNRSGWEAVGYDGRHDSLEGFANFHEFQIGGLVLMPTIGALQTVPGELNDPDGGYRSRFDKADEQAEPGFYSVRLKDYGVLAELTATPRVAFHRYTYPPSSQAHLLLDVGHRQGESGAVLDAVVQRSGDREIEGMLITHPEYVKSYQPGAVVKMYFVAQLSQTPRSVGTFRGSTVEPNRESIMGPGAGLVLHFDTTLEPTLEVKLGLSYTSTENARLNLHREADGLSFDQARRQAQDRWNAMLGRIQVSGGRESDRVKFYTALYHALLGRGLASDVNGAYPRNDGGIGQIPLSDDGTPPYHHYNSDAVWGTFWNLTQLWALAYPDYFNDYVRCHLDHFRDCGWLPDSVATGKFVSGVGTDYMGLVVSSAYLRGIRDYDAEQAFAAVWKNETGWQNRPVGVGKADLKAFLDLGYSPLIPSIPGLSASTAEGSQFSASHTLEYSFSAFAASEFARALGKPEEHRQLRQRSEGWKHLLDPETRFIRPKDAQGNFIAHFEPRKPWLGFQEGNAWQYTFYVPHDPAELIRLISHGTFNDRLDAVFSEAEKTQFGGGQTVNAFAGIENVYNHGNQPSLHIAWLFNYGGRPWLTQHWVRRICEVFYGTDTVHGYGYGQDEDQGQLGAWLVLAGVGLFDVQGLTARNATLQLSTPLFERVRIQLHPHYHSDSAFEIQTRGDPAQAPYIQSARLNGQPLEDCWIPWETVVRGGRLELTLGTEPHSSWGTAHPPPSASLPASLP